MKELYIISKKYKELITYIFVGVLTTIVNLVIYYIFTRICNFSPYTSNIIAWIVAVLFAFFSNKFIVFKSIDKRFKTIFKEGISFTSMRILSLGLEMITLYILISIFSWNDMVVKLIAQIIVTVSNYIFSKLFIFKKS